MMRNLILKSNIIHYFILSFRPEEAKGKTDANTFIDKVQAPSVMVTIAFAILVIMKSPFSKD